MNLSDYRDRPHWSYSSLNQLLNVCSLQWMFEKLLRLPRPFTPVSLALGSAYHRVMEFIAMHRLEGRLPMPTETRDLFHTLWEREQKEGPPMEKTEDPPEKLAEQGAGLVAAYLQQVDPREKIIEINQAFAVPVGSSERPLIGEIDCVVESADGQTVLVDWKTSARRWPKDQADKSLQPTAYLYAYSQLKPGCTDKFRFDVAVKNKTPVVELNHTSRISDDFQRLERLVEAADRIVQHELYYPCDQSFACAGCQYAEPCKAWHRQAARKTVNLAA